MTSLLSIFVMALSSAKDYTTHEMEGDKEAIDLARKFYNDNFQEKRSIRQLGLAIIALTSIMRGCVNIAANEVEGEAAVEKKTEFVN